VALVSLLPAGPAQAGPVDRPGVGLAWYDVTAQTVAAAAFPEPVTQSRAWAVSWLAGARAVGDGRDPRYAIAAFVTALHDTLTALVPARGAQLDQALTATLSGVPDGPAKERGVASGRREASAVLAERAGDGLDTASIDIAWSPPPAAPGIWQPTPPSYGPAVRAGEGRARSFLLRTGSQFRPPPPPALTSARYLESLAEVRSVGAATSSVRTAQQTDVALFWEQNSIDAYAQVLRAVLARPGGTLAGQARLVAAFHVITIDAQIAVYEAKYVYLFWRPVTAIRAGEVAAEPGWTPLFNTPRHPDYPSGHAGYAGAAQWVLEGLVGAHPEQPIGVTSATEPGATHTFRAWSTITQENVDGRVWEGIHFRFSDETAVQLGAQVAAYDLVRLDRLRF
jgi:hypothetical protein